MGCIELSSTLSGDGLTQVSRGGVQDDGDEMLVVPNCCANLGSAKFPSRGNSSHST
jgi:hypothetical protein